jgi:hypothetical protein
MGKKSRSGSRMNIPDHISESLETIFGLKILKIFLCGSGIFLSWIRDGKIRILDKHPGSSTQMKIHSTGSSDRILVSGSVSSSPETGAGGLTLERRYSNQAKKGG